MPKLTADVPAKGLKAPTIQSILIQDANGDGILSADETAVVTFAFSTIVTGFDLSDVTVTNGSLGGLSTLDGGKTWRAYLKPALGVEASSQISVTGTYTDTAGNVGTGTKTPTSILVDSKPPAISSISITDAGGDGTVRAGETATVAIAFSEKVSGFDRSDLIVTNGTVGALSSSDGGKTWTGVFTPAAATEAVAQISVAASYSDVAGNAGTASKSPASILVDTRGPTIASLSITDESGDGTVRAGETATVTIAFSEKVSGFDRSDITVTNGTVGALSSSDGGKTWIGVFTPATATEAVAQISVAASYTDLAGNAGTASKSPASILVDTRGPTIASVSITDESGDGTLRAGETATVKFAFSEKITGFDSSDVTVTNGSLGPISSADGGLTWTGKFTPSGGVEALAQFSVGPNYSDLAGNSGSGSKAPSSIFVDSKAPFLSSILVEDQNGDGVVRAGETAAVTFTFSEKVSGFDVSDVTTLNGSLGSLSSGDGGKTWKGTFTPAAATDFVALITVAPTYTDLAGNAGTPSTNPGYIRVDTKAPYLTSFGWHDTNGDGVVSSSETAKVTFSFSEKVTGFDDTDLVVTNGTLTGLSSLDGQIWTAELAPAAGTEGSAQISLLSSYTDQFGNPGTAAASLPTISVDTKGPTLSSFSISDTSGDGIVSAGEAALVTLRFSEKIESFDASDVTLNLGSLSTLLTLDGGQTWLGTVVPASDFGTSAHLALAGTYTDLAGNAGQSSVMDAVTAAGTPPNQSRPAPTQVEPSTTLSAIDSAWKVLPIGAGGWITGIDIAPDGTKVIRTDTYGAYRMNADGVWKQLVTSSSMPSGTPHGGGVYEIQVADSDPNIMYMNWGDGIYKTADGGNHWVHTALSGVYSEPNGTYRMFGQKMAIDPNNPNVVVVGTENDGIFSTYDGGSTWARHWEVPKALDSAGVTGIVFSGSGTVYASSSGNGVYQSTDSGHSWQRLTGGPTGVEYAAVDSAGNYYAVGGTSDDSLYKYIDATDTWVKLASGGIHAIAVNPENNNELIVTRDSGNLMISRDGGATWGDGWNWNNQLESSQDVPWLDKSGSYMSSGGLAFDPANGNKIFQAGGVGVWETDLPGRDFSWGSLVQWQSKSLGIEQLVVNDIVAPVGGGPIVASWDRPFFAASGGAYPTSYNDGSGGQDFSAGWSLDYASSNPSFIVGLSEWWGGEHSGFSTDGGQTWHPFAAHPSSATMGGSIAASTPLNLVWAPANQGRPAYTLDGGSSWTDVRLPDHDGDWSVFHYAYYLDRTTVAADRAQANTFYLYDAGSGLYRTEDGGPTWERVYTGQIAPWSYYNAKIEAAPDSAGELYFTGGPDGDPYVRSDAPFMHSTDGGHTWAEVPNVSEVLTFGFGKAAFPGGPATLDIVGYVAEHYGIWQSQDGARTWTQIGETPLGSLDNIKTITGDMNNDNVYIGFAGSGAAYWAGHDGIF